MIKLYRRGKWSKIELKLQDETDKSIKHIKQPSCKKTLGECIVEKKKFHFKTMIIITFFKNMFSPKLSRWKQQQEKYVIL